MPKTPPEKLEAIKRWRAENPEKVLAARKRYRERNPEKMREASKAWRDKAKDPGHEAKQRKERPEVTPTKARVKDPGYGTRYYREHRDHLIEESRRWREANPDRVETAMLRTRAAKYGLTLEELLDLYERLGHACGICGEPPPEGRRLCVDHDHDTGKVRGLLCNRCNRDLDRLVPHLHQVLSYLGIEEKPVAPPG